MPAEPPVRMSAQRNIRHQTTVAALTMLPARLRRESGPLGGSVVVKVNYPEKYQK